MVEVKAMALAVLVRKLEASKRKIDAKRKIEEEEKEIKCGRG